MEERFGSPRGGCWHRCREGDGIVCTSEWADITTLDTSANPDWSGDACGEQGDTCGVKCCGDGESMISCPDFDSADTTDTFMQSLSAQCAQAYAEQGRPWIPSTNVVCASTSRQLSYLDAAGIAGGYLALIDGIITMLVIVIYLLGTCQRPADIIAAAKAVNRSETDDLQTQMDELVPIIEKFTGYRWDAILEKFDTPTQGAEDRDARATKSNRFGTSTS